MKTDHYLPCNSQIKCQRFHMFRDHDCDRCKHYHDCPVLWAYCWTERIGRPYTWRDWFRLVRNTVVVTLLRGLPRWY